MLTGERSVAMPQQKSLVLILARGLADELASAIFMVDREGTLQYFNEAAEEILGVPFADVGETSPEQWLSAFEVLDLQNHPIPMAEWPIMVALNDHVPTHRALRIQQIDGKVHDIAVTAFPLFARKEELVGAVAIFWEHGAAEEKGT
jgi:PAS domain-containing protein